MVEFMLQVALLQSDSNMSYHNLIFIYDNNMSYLGKIFYDNNMSYNYEIFIYIYIYTYLFYLITL